MHQQCVGSVVCDAHIKLFFKISLNSKLNFSLLINFSLNEFQRKNKKKIHSKRIRLCAWVKMTSYVKNKM
jgi:hypothetical protein